MTKAAGKGTGTTARSTDSKAVRSARSKATPKRKRGEQAARKPWGGRFDGATDPAVERFSASIEFDKALARIKSNPAWRTYEAPCGHDVMVDMPVELAAELLRLA